jgi:hypothetical protein
MRTELTINIKFDPLYRPTWPPWDFQVFGKLKTKIISEAGDFHLTTPSKPRSGSGFDNVSVYAQGFEGPTVLYDRCLNKLDNCVEK